jgi:hypothetical protein
MATLVPEREGSVALGYPQGPLPSDGRLGNPGYANQKPDSIPPIRVPGRPGREQQNGQRIGGFTNGHGNDSLHAGSASSLVHKIWNALFPSQNRKGSPRSDADTNELPITDPPGQPMDNVDEVENPSRKTKPLGHRGASSQIRPHFTSCLLVLLVILFMDH